MSTRVVISRRVKVVATVAPFLIHVSKCNCSTPQSFLRGVAQRQVKIEISGNLYTIV